jgi:formate dehydrogenase subunit gamma
MMRRRALFLTAWLGLCSVLGGASLSGVAATAATNDEADMQATRQTEQPLNNAPVWRSVRSGREHATQVSGRETGVLIQSAGETWRQIRNGPVTLIGGLLLILVPITIAVFYGWSGPLKLRGQPSGRLVERFTYWERIIHWSTAITFVALAVTGTLIFFGKRFSESRTLSFNK